MTATRVAAIEERLFGASRAPAHIGRFVVLRLSDQTYRALIDGLMVCSGVSLLWAATR